MRVITTAPPNIALIKYWGKSDHELNLPATGSISVNLAELYTRMEVSLAHASTEDALTINGQTAPKELGKITKFLNFIRLRYGRENFLKIESEGNFPIGAGIASSASAFAALSLAVNKVMNLNLDANQISALARVGSGSAARSIPDGWVRMSMAQSDHEMDAHADSIASVDHWPLEIAIAICETKEKSVASTQGMEISRHTSPYYPAWISSHQKDMLEAQSAVQHRDFEKLAEITEHSCMKMHALMLSSRPSLLYWNPTTVNVIHSIQEMRNNGIPVFFTIDAGPQVKLFFEKEHANQVYNALNGISGVMKVLKSRVGVGARILDS